MPTPFSTGPGYEAFNLVQSRAVSSVLSPDERTLFVSTTDGKILVFDLSTLALVRTINVAGQLGAMNISDDGATAYVVGSAAAGGNRGIYQVDLASGTRSLLPNSSNLSPFDVEFIDGDRLLISGTQSWIYNLSTQTATSAASGDLPGYGSITSMVESDGLVLTAELEASNGALELYDETQGRVISSGSTFAGGGPIGFNNGVMAVSREAGLIAVYVTQEGLKVFDLNFNLVHAESFWGFFDDGFAFSDDGSFLLALLGRPADRVRHHHLDPAPDLRHV